MSETGIRQQGRTDLPGANTSRRIQNQDVALGSLQWRHMNFRHMYVAPIQQPMVQSKGATGSVPSGATGATNLCHFLGQGILEQHIKGAGQTAIVPTIAADGLEVSGDQASTEGFEYYAGLTLRTPGVFQVGVDPAFFLRARFVIDDVSGANPFFLGFTINSARQTAVGTYTDFAGLNLNAGQWESITRLASGSVTTTVLTGSTVADLGNFEIFVNVSSAGAVTYQIGTVTAGVSSISPAFSSNSAPSLAPAFSLAASTLVTASCFFLHTVDLADSIRLRQFEAGFQSNYLPN